MYTPQQQLYSLVAHEGHPDQVNQVVLVDLLSHYSHPPLANLAHHLPLGAPEEKRKVMLAEN